MEELNQEIKAELEKIQAKLQLQKPLSGEEIEVLLIDLLLREEKP